MRAIYNLLLLLYYIQFIFDLREFLAAGAANAAPTAVAKNASNPKPPPRGRWQALKSPHIVGLFCP